jgi:hypothetical protein
VDLLAQAPLRAPAHALTNNEHVHHELGIDP